MKSAGKIVLALLGLALFAWFVRRAGPGEILTVFSRLGWWLPVALLPFLLVYCIDTLAWRMVFTPPNPTPPYGLLLRIRWAGEAVNSLIPTGYVGGEAIKAWLLHRRGYSLSAATTSVVVSKTMQVAAQVVFIALGAALAYTHLPAGSSARSGFAVISGLAVIVLLLLMWIQTRGLFSFVQALATRLRLRLLDQHRSRLRELDDCILGFYRAHPRAALTSALVYLAGWLGDALEVFVVSHLLGFSIDYPTALAIESFISVAKALGIFVPGSLGVQESGVWLLFSLFGLGQPEAVAYAILRRGRDSIYAGIGTALLYAEGGSLRGPGAPSPVGAGANLK